MSDYNPKSNVVWGDIDLSEYDAFAFYCNIFDKPDRDVSAISIPGRNGDILFDNGRYKNIERVYQIQVTGLDNINNLMRDLVACTGYHRLEDEYDTDVYMEARLKSPPATKRFVGDSASITLVFDRKPQRYLKSGDTAILPNNITTFDTQKEKDGVYSPCRVLIAEFTIDNNSGSISRPLINIKKWDCRVDQFWIATATNVNDLQYQDIVYKEYKKVNLGCVRDFTMGSRDLYVKIDCENKTYSSNTIERDTDETWINIGPEAYNDFPMLKIGTNYIRIVYTTYDEAGSSGSSYSEASAAYLRTRSWPEIYPRWITL